VSYALADDPTGTAVAVDSNKFTRKTISVPNGLWDWINDFRFERRFATESDAMVYILQRGREVLEAEGREPPPTRLKGRRK
jgi:hypothetical protein